MKTFSILAAAFAVLFVISLTGCGTGDSNAKLTAGFAVGPDDAGTKLVTLTISNGITPIEHIEVAIDYIEEQPASDIYAVISAGTINLTPRTTIGVGYDNHTGGTLSRGGQTFMAAAGAFCGRDKIELENLAPGEVITITAPYRRQ